MKYNFLQEVEEVRVDPNDKVYSSYLFSSDRELIRYHAQVLIDCANLRESELISESVLISEKESLYMRVRAYISESVFISERAHLTKCAHLRESVLTCHM